jgi:gamma-glutamylcyclotransferase (GGCT)/AIG2-like uncharacterized protein YtfP
MGGVRADRFMMIDFSSLYAAAARTLDLPVAEVTAMVSRWAFAPADGFETPHELDPTYEYDRLVTTTNSDGLRRALRRLGFYVWLSQRLPVFVYGTLRQGQSNAHRMSQIASLIDDAVVDGVAVFGADQLYPHAVERSGASTLGELVWLRPEIDHREAYRSLDEYEEFMWDRPWSSEYERVVRPVRLSNGDTVSAWLYLARGRVRESLAEATPIPGGDWIAARRA